MFVAFADELVVQAPVAGLVEADAAGPDVRRHRRVVTLPRFDRRRFGDLVQRVRVVASTSQCAAEHAVVADGLVVAAVVERAEPRSCPARAARTCAAARCRPSTDRRRTTRRSGGSPLSCHVPFAEYDVVRRSRSTPPRLSEREPVPAPGTCGRLPLRIDRAEEEQLVLHDRAAALERRRRCLRGPSVCTRAVGRLELLSSCPRGLSAACSRTPTRAASFDAALRRRR